MLVGLTVCIFVPFPPADVCTYGATAGTAVRRDLDTITLVVSWAEAIFIPEKIQIEKKIIISPMLFMIITFNMLPC